MDKISEFFQQLKERLTSPFFSSFVVAWLLWNWRIPIVLFFDSKEWLITNGYCSYTDYLTAYVDTYHGIIYPTLSALFYVYSLKNLFSALETWSVKWGTKLNLKLSNKSFVTIDIFRELESDLLATTKGYEDMIKDRSAFQSEKLGLLDQIKTSSNDLFASQQQIHSYQEMTNRNQLYGNWMFLHNTYISEEDKFQIISEKVHINDKGIYVIDDNRSLGGQPDYTVNFYYSRGTENLAGYQSSLVTVLIITDLKLKIIEPLIFNNYTKDEFEGKDVHDRGISLKRLIQ